jgi:hypothetical protein
MSTGCAVLFGGNIHVFFIFPLGGTTDFLGRFFKSIINAIYVSKKKKKLDIAKIKTNQKTTKTLLC